MSCASAVLLSEWDSFCLCPSWIRSFLYVFKLAPAQQLFCVVFVSLGRADTSPSLRLLPSLCLTQLFSGRPSWCPPPWTLLPLCEPRALIQLDKHFFGFDPGGGLGSKQPHSDVSVDKVWHTLTHRCQFRLPAWLRIINTVNKKGSCCCCWKSALPTPLGQTTFSAHVANRWKLQDQSLVSHSYKPQFIKLFT